MPQAQRNQSSLSTVQVNALIAEIARFTQRIRERGKRYAAGGRVSVLTMTGTCVNATVRGTERYETLWDWNGVSWDPDCSCPVGPYCKHAYAVACCIIASNRETAAFAHPRLERLLPKRWPAPALRHRDTSAGVQRLSPEPPRSALERLRSARDPWARERHFLELVERAARAGFHPRVPPFPDILREADPDLLCWRLAQAIPAWASGWLPAALQPFRNRPDLAARAAGRARTQLANELVQWAAQQRKSARRRLRLVFGLITRREGLGVTVEARVTTPRMSDAPRNMTQLQQLRNEIRRSPGLFPPEQAALLYWLVDHNVGATDRHYSHYANVRQLAGATLKSLLPQVDGSPLAAWAADIAPELAARAGITPGAPVRLAPEPARLLPTCVSRGDGMVGIDFAFLWPDGRQRRLEDVLYLPGGDEWSRVQPSFVLADGMFSLVIEAPPDALLERFSEAGGLPLPPADRGPIISLLAANFPHLETALAGHVRFHPVKPVVALDLNDDDWLQIRLLAHTARETWRPGDAVAPDTLVFEYIPEGRWVAVEPPPASDQGSSNGAYDAIKNEGPRQAPAVAVDSPAIPPAAAPDGEAWLDAPAPQDVGAALQWLKSLEVGPGTKGNPGGREPSPWARHVGWWAQATRRRMDAFAEAWEQRPQGVDYFGTERVRRLLSGELRVTPLLHIEPSGVDWFSVSAEWTAEGLQLSDADLAKLRAATTRFVKLAGGWVRRDAAAVHDEAAAVLADLGIEAGQGPQRLTLWQLAGAQPESLNALRRFGADAETLRALERLRARVASFDGLPPIAPPAGLTAQLRPYQQRGLDFLVYTSSFEIGAVLADDMGLGKTVQALAWLAHLYEQEPDGGPALVVCPASVVHNWAREAARFTPGLRVLLLTRGRTRHELRRQIPSHDLIVTNYALLRRDLEEWRKLNLRAAILDEAQNIKNPDAAVTRAALELQARHRLALTGTPLENRALDLWSIVSFVNPGYLGRRSQFQQRFDRLDAPPHARSLLAAKLRPVLLRRTKQEVATDLPDRIEERRDCELTREQRHLYLAELRRSRALVEDLSEAPGGLTQNKIHILAALTRLRQICCHPALAGGKKSLDSGKFEALFELLDPLLAEGHKVLLFSQFVECIKLLAAALRARGITYHTLTGQTSRRQHVVDAFQADPDPCVFLISLKAGGTGLNLTAASYVILFDPWWNPAVEAQAIDRTHRIGQDRTVIAYRMLTCGTVEEKIWELQQRKAALARDILGEGGFARTLTRGDLDYLLAEA